MVFINTVYFDLGERTSSPPPRASRHRRRHSHSRRRHAHIDKHHIDDICAYVKNIQQQQRQVQSLAKWDPIGEAFKATFFGYAPYTNPRAHAHWRPLDWPRLYKCMNVVRK